MKLEITFEEALAHFAKFYNLPVDCISLVEGWSVEREVRSVANVGAKIAQVKALREKGKAEYSEDQIEKYINYGKVHGFSEAYPGSSYWTDHGWIGLAFAKFLVEKINFK